MRMGVYVILTDRDAGTMEITGPYDDLDVAVEYAEAWLARTGNLTSCGWHVGEMATVTINSLTIHLPSD